MPVKFVLICGIVLELKKVLDRKKKKKNARNRAFPLWTALIELSIAGGLSNAEMAMIF